LTDVEFQLLIAAFPSRIAEEGQVFRVGVLLVALACLAGTTPSLAQSLESQGYRFSRREHAWVPVPAYRQPRAEGDSEFIKVLTLQNYYFNRAENTWKPQTRYLVW
jgi:predicted metal-dependent HD superfamily phosphohydrolase